MDLGLVSMFGVYGVGFAAVVVSLMIFNWVWLKPKRIEKRLRNQGLKGTSYKLLYGDLKELKYMTSESYKKPMNLTDDIIPRVLPFHHHVVTTHGKNCFTWMGPRPLLHITDPTTIREIFGNHEDFQKPSGGNPLRRMLVTGLLGTEGDQWVRHRKIINPAFHIEKLKHMVTASYTSSHELINKWENMLKKERSCEINVWPDLLTLATDVISRTTFSSSYEQGQKIFELQREQAKLLMAISQSIYIPGSHFLPTNVNKRMKANAQDVKRIVSDIISKRVMEMKEGKSKDDLLGILLKSNFKESEKQGNSKFGLSIDDIIEECKLFYFAGQETTATLLLWTMVLLGQHQDWQHRAREEVLKVFGDGKPDVDGLSQLKVINMILLEVLRLYPPATMLTRMTHKETKLGNITLPVGTFLQLHIMLSHYDPCIWGDDVKEFHPERFSEGTSKVTNGQIVYFPFGGGPRFCIGQNFAMMEAKIALTTILSRFSFELSPLYTHSPCIILTLQPQFGAHLVLHKL